MRKTGVKLGLLGAFAAAAVLTGCAKDQHVWALTAQEDYYDDQAQDAVGKERSNLGTSSKVFETDEQLRGTGGAGQDPKAAERDNVQAQTPDQGRRTPEQEAVWLQQDDRTRFPPLTVQTPFGTGKPLKAVNGVWVQGTHGVERGATGGRGMNPVAGTGLYSPQEPTEGSEAAPPQVPTTDHPEGQSH
jgi:hypothetical protein